MKVFISWSGKKSMEVAKVLKWWVKNVIQSTEPFVSDDDIALGTKWSERITNELAETMIGIICITPDNQSAPWINFEAGAISKVVEGEQNKVVPVLIDFMKKTDYKGPLSAFNLALLDREGLLKLAKSINATLTSSRPEADVVETFETWWPQLEERLKEVHRNTPVAPQPERRMEDVTSEILERVRSLAKADGVQDKLESRPAARTPRGASGLFFELVKEAAGDDYGRLLLSTRANGRYTIKTETEMPLAKRFKLAKDMVAANPNADIDFEILDEQDIYSMDLNDDED